MWLGLICVVCICCLCGLFVALGFDSVCFIDWICVDLVYLVICYCCWLVALCLICLFV